MDTEPEDPLERRRDELRRMIYGAPGDPSGAAAEELAAVERELAARHDAEDAAAAESPAQPSADDEPDAPPRTDDDSSEAPVPDADAADDTAPDRRPGRRLLIVALVALALIVAGIALIGPTRELLSPPRGLDVFERTPTAEEQELADQVATAAGLGPDDATTLRSVGRAFGYAFWVYRDRDRVCLLSQREYWFEWVRTCATVDDFRKMGLTRAIVGDDIRDGARPRRIQPDDLVLVTWGPGSIEIEWEVEPGS